MDIMHVYEQSKRLLFLNGMTQQLTEDYESFNGPVREMIAQAEADLTSEGLNARDAVFSVELDMLYGGQVQVKRVASPLLQITDVADAQAVYDAFEKEYSEAFSPHVVNKPGGAYIEGIVVKATVPTEKLELPVHELGVKRPVGGARREPRRPTGRPPERRDTASAHPSTASTGSPPATRSTARHSSRRDFTTIVVPPGKSPEHRPARPRPAAEHRRRGQSCRAARTAGRSSPMSYPTLAEKLAALNVSEPTEYELSCLGEVGTGDYEIGVQRTADILDEGYEVFMRSSRTPDGHRR